MTTRESESNNAHVLLSQMTLEEKIGLTIGQDFWSTRGVERLGVAPIALMGSQHGVLKPMEEGTLGIGSSHPATCFPTASALASSWDPSLAHEVGEAIAQECLEFDVQVLLGPAVNIKRTPLGGRNFEYYSEDPVVAGALGTAYVNGLQSKGIGASLKHYACNNQEYERMIISAEVDQSTLREIYLPAFERVVTQAQPWTVMSSYNRVNGLYASEHPELLHTILREEWGFEGTIVSDWGAVNDRGKALAAGLNLQMPGYPGDHIQKVVGLVRSGALPEAVIDEAATHVLTLLLRGHANRQPGYTFDRDAHHALARKAAAEAIVLLKNTDALLPLQKERLRSVALIGRYAQKPHYQGEGSSHVVPTRVDSTYEEMQRWLGGEIKLVYGEGYKEEDEIDEALLQNAVAQAQAADVAILCVGLPEGSESEGFDRPHIEMPASHNRLIEDVCKVQANTIVVLHNGSAVAMPWIAGPKAILEAGLGGQAIGGAVVDVLSGIVNPSGKLTETFPLRLEDTPAYINYPGKAQKVSYGEGLFVGYRYYEKKKINVLFPFGHGLSYTTFEYRDVRVSKTQIRPGEEVEVTVNVRNGGNRAGKEVVQLYLRALNSRFARPIKELKGFSKVALAAGESKDVSLRLAARDFSVYDSERQAWHLDGGAFEILVGPASDQCVLSARISVEEDLQPPVFTRSSLIKQVLQWPQARAVLTNVLPLALAGAQEETFDYLPVRNLVMLGSLDDDKVDELVAQMNHAVQA